MPSRYSTYDDYNDNDNNSYASQRNSRRQSRIKVVDVPDDRISFIRQRELAAFYGDPDKSLVLRRDESSNNVDTDDVTNSRQLTRTQRSSIDDSGYYPRGTNDYDNNRRSGRSSRRDSEYNADDRRGGRRRARAQSQGGWGQQNQQDQQLQRTRTQGQGQAQPRGCYDENGRLMKISLNKDKMEDGQLRESICRRKDGNLVERNFDSSWDGIIAAGAGAAIGAITARRLRPIYVTDEQRDANKKKDRMYMIGGAVVGAAAVNAGENWFRVWAEEHAEGAEGAHTAGHVCAEALQSFPIS